MPLIQQFDTTMQVLEKVLDLRAKKQEIIAANIANAETPGYAPVSFEFEEQLRSALEQKNLKMTTTNPEHISIFPPSIKQVEGTISRHPDRSAIGDGNGVDVDKEMLDLAQNQILYEAATTMLNKKLSMLKYTANDGR